jgi:hypothetical protein
MDLGVPVLARDYPRLERNRTGAPGLLLWLSRYERGRLHSPH